MTVQPWVQGIRDVAESWGVTGVLRAVFTAVDTPVLAYFLLINTSYLVLVVLAATEFAGHLRRVPFSGLDDAAASPLTQPVSVLVPGFNEEAGIVASVRAMLALRYSEHEVVVIDDGSTDGTFERLRAGFDLVEVPRVMPDDVPVRERPRSVHVPRDGRTPLVVVRKANSGRSDSLNVGLNLARNPLVAMVDADSLLDPDALLVVAKPFADDPLRVVATGGVIRAANGSRVVAGRVVDVRMPQAWLSRIQVMEYLRAFLLGRTGWSRLESLILISGAFGLFRRDVVVEAGGLDPATIGEDFELVLRIHRLMRDQRRDYRVVFVAEPVSWTEVPVTRAVLARQRRRWHRGAGTFRTDSTDLDLAALVRAVELALRPQAETAGVVLQVDAGPGGLRVRGDEMQLERVLLNVLSNAVKFTPAGGTVHLSVEGSGATVQLRCRDTGIGIPAAEQVHLFDRFFRASNATAQAVPGTGLGLVIVRGIVERHGGRIELESTEGRGTTVTVRLPLAGPGGPVPAGTAAAGRALSPDVTPLAD